MKGYTLIEILVGITIIGLIFGFGFVSFREFSRRQSLMGAAKNIQGDLRLTQELALAGQKPDSDNPDYLDCQSPNILGGYNFRIVGGTSYLVEANCTGGTAEIKEVLLPVDITISTPNPNPITFKALGQGTNIPSGPDVVLTLTQAGTGTQTTITISFGGDIK